eukprot:6195036-Pleurochrysis_carterae.AAC.1
MCKAENEGVPKTAPGRGGNATGARQGKPMDEVSSVLRGAADNLQYLDVNRSCWQGASRARGTARSVQRGALTSCVRASVSAEDAGRTFPPHYTNNDAFGRARLLEKGRWVRRSLLSTSKAWMSLAPRLHIWLPHTSG